jgi:hypothetical protein
MSSPNGMIARRLGFSPLTVEGLGFVIFLPIALCASSCGSRSAQRHADQVSVEEDRKSGPETPAGIQNRQVASGKAVVEPPPEVPLWQSGKGRVRVIVLTASGTPVADRSVTMWYPGGGTCTHQTDERGRCFFDNLSPGEYHFCVTVRLNRDCDCAEKTVKVEADVLHELDFSGYRLVLWKGKIFDHAGKRVSRSVHIGLYDCGRDRWFEQWRVIPHDMDFSVEGLSPGTYLWLLSEERMFPNNCAYGMGTIVIPDQLEFTQDIHLPGSIRGVVRLGSGSAVADAVVGIVPVQFKPKRSNWAIEIQTRTDYTGAFEVHGVADGVYTVWVLKGYSASSRALVIDAEARKKQVILNLKG